MKLGTAIPAASLGAVYIDFKSYAKDFLPFWFVYI